MRSKANVVAAYRRGHGSSASAALKAYTAQRFEAVWNCWRLLDASIQLESKTPGVYYTSTHRRCVVATGVSGRIDRFRCDITRLVSEHWTVSSQRYHQLTDAWTRPTCTSYISTATCVTVQLLTRNNCTSEPYVTTITLIHDEKEHLPHS